MAQLHDFAKIFFLGSRLRSLYVVLIDGVDSMNPDSIFAQIFLRLHADVMSAIVDVALRLRTNPISYAGKR